MKEKSKKAKDEQKAFAERIRILVRSAGNTSKLARNAGVPECSIRQYLTGKNDPSRTRLIALANAACVSLQWLATGEAFPGEDIHARFRKEINILREQIDALEGKLMK